LKFEILFELESVITMLANHQYMSVTLQELSKKVEELEKYLKSLIDVNLELIEEEEPEEWEVKDIEERRKDEFLDWKSIENEL